MNAYRLMIYQHERLLGHFESTAPWAREAVAELHRQLGPMEGFRLELLEGHDERRLVESTPHGVRLLYSELLFRPIALDAA
nr:cytoplasmic protein [Herbaspirillum sp. ASV7]